MYLDELMHYGVLGMKWGVRRYQNKDGTLTAAGKKRKSTNQDKEDISTSAGKKKLANQINDVYSKEYKVLKKNHFVGSRNTDIDTVKQFDDIKTKVIDSEPVTKARDKWRKAAEVGKEYYTNDEVWRKYTIKAADKFAEEYGWDKEKARNWYLYDDGDQGDDNSFNLYLKDKGVDLNKYYKETIDAKREYMDACSKAVDDLLGEYGNTQLKAVQYNKTVKDLIVNVAENLTLDETEYLYGTFRF